MKKKLNLNIKSLPLILAGVILLASILGGGYYFWKFKDKPNDDNNQPKVTSKITNLGNGFMEYQSDNYGFSFKYPQEWGNVININGFVLYKKMDRNCSEKENIFCPFLSINVQDPQKYSLTLSAINNQIEKQNTYPFSESEILEKEKISISNIDSWKMKFWWNHNLYNYYIPLHKMGYFISIGVNPDNEDNNIQIKELIKSIKIL